ncbi:TPA: hypothetical protein ACH3X2_012895 [Trebouxia sp. C0005]
MRWAYLTDAVREAPQHLTAADGPAAADAVVQFQPPSGELHQDLLPWTVPHDLAFICKCGDEVWVLYDDLGKYWTRGMVIDLSEENVLVCFFDLADLHNLELTKRSRRLWRGDPIDVTSWNRKHSTTEKWILKHKWWDWQMYSNGRQVAPPVRYSHGAAGRPIEGPSQGALTPPPVHSFPSKRARIGTSPTRRVATSAVPSAATSLLRILGNSDTTTYAQQSSERVKEVNDLLHQNREFTKQRSGRRPRKDMEVLMRRFRDTLAADVPPLGTAADEGVSGGPQQQAVVVNPPPTRPLSARMARGAEDLLAISADTADPDMM